MTMRSDLRANHELRELSYEIGLISEAIGSCRLQQGKMKKIYIKYNYKHIYTEYFR